MTRAKEQLYVGVDVGTTKVATVVARVASSGGMQAVAVGHAPSDGMRKGVVADAAAVVDAVRRSVSDASAALGKRLPPAYVSVAGAHLGSVNAAAAITRAPDQGRPGAFTQADVDGLLASSVPEMDASRMLLHAVPRRFGVDGQAPVHDPVEDTEGIAQALYPLADHLIATRAPSERAMATQELLAIGTSPPHRQAVDDPAEALAAARDAAAPEDLICVCGSTYLIGAVRPLLIDA